VSVRSIHERCASLTSPQVSQVSRPIEAIASASMTQSSGRMPRAAFRGRVKASFDMDGVFAAGRVSKIAQRPALLADILRQRAGDLPEQYQRSRFVSCSGLPPLSPTAAPGRSGSWLQRTSLIVALPSPRQ